MNKWNKLLAILDDLYGHGAKQRSRISQKVEGFDNQTGERVIRIEYRIKMVSESAGGLLRSANDRLNRSDPQP